MPTFAKASVGLRGGELSMATVVTNQPSDDSGHGIGFLLGVILLILAFIALAIYGLPLLRGAGTSTGTSVTLPSEVNVNTK